MVDAKTHRERQVAIANKVSQPVYVAPPKKSHIKRCEKCRRVLTGEDIKSYRLESKDFGYPSVCTKCAEDDARLVTGLEEPDKIGS